MPRAAAAQPLGDRLVLAVNNVPYTQRQVETYVTVKESLRKTSDGSVRLIDARNWGEALTAFTEDSIILQEAQRLGSFTAADQAIDKYSALLRDKIMHGRELQATLKRLGVDDQALARTLEDVLRVVAFRRSKDRQETQGAAKGVKQSQAAAAKWLTELTDRAVVRQFEDAARYEVIQPTLGAKGRGHGP